MNKNRCTIIDIYQIVTLTGVFFATWKFAHYWHAGLAEKTDHTIDASIGAAAEKLEKTAIVLKKWADGDNGDTSKKNLVEVLTDTRKSLEMAIDIVQRALQHTK